MLAIDSVQSGGEPPAVPRKSVRNMDSCNSAFSGKHCVAGSSAAAILGAPPRDSW